MVTNNDPHSDLALFELMTQGDQEAFTSLYRRHHQGIYNFLLRIVKIPTFAEDLMQDVFVKIWEDCQQIHITASFSSYLYQTARHKAIDALRRIARESVLEDEVRHRLASGLDHLMHTEYEWREYEFLLNQAIEALPPQRRRAFELVRQEGKKYEEAAALMGISRNTLKQHISLAVESIRRSFMEHGVAISAVLFIYYLLS
jgi:RNA polymerase sigma-70 factor (ECF subfamily)